jgi:hypothetical protein
MPQRPVGLDPPETFTERDEARNVKDCVGIQIMKLNPVSEKGGRGGKDAGEETNPAIERR